MPDTATAAPPATEPPTCPRPECDLPVLATQTGPRGQTFHQHQPDWNRYCITGLTEETR